MKKLFFLLCFSLLTRFSLSAQEKQQVRAKKSSSARYVKKSDGTPDMRYKSNKEMVRKGAKGPLKKDGSPDKRYKVNKP